VLILFAVIITSSSDEKLAHAKSLGADHVINYRKRPDWEAEVLSMTNNRGADIIFENGGAQTLTHSFKCVSFGGLINCIGYLSGKMDTNKEPTLHTNVMALMRNVTLKGLLNGPKDRFEDMVKFIAENNVHMVVDRVFSFDEARNGLIYLFKGSHFGKVVVKV
jgi:NADPH:quinone reductase-like Zn-dependent oxidoreductase